MGLFKKKFTSQDVDNFYKKRDYRKLIKLLTNEDQSVVQKTENALRELAIDEDAKKDRRQWVDYAYENLLKHLESPKLSKHKTAIEPLIKAFRQEHELVKEKDRVEREEVNVLKKRLEELGGPEPDEDVLRNININLKPDEIIEYSQKLVDRTRTVLSYEAILVTNEKLLYYKVGLNQWIELMKYDSITSIKRGFMSITINSEQISITIPKSEKQLIFHIANHVSELKDISE